MLFTISTYIISQIFFYTFQFDSKNQRTNERVRKEIGSYSNIVSLRSFFNACGSVSPRPIIVHDIPYLHGTNNFASRYRTPYTFNVHLCPSGIKTTASYSEMYTVLNNNGKVCSSFDRYRVGGETIAVKVRVHVNRKIRFNTLISFCF